MQQVSVEGLSNPFLSTGRLGQPACGGDHKTFVEQCHEARPVLVYEGLQDRRFENGKVRHTCHAVIILQARGPIHTATSGGANPHAHRSAPTGGGKTHLIAARIAADECVWRAA